MRGLVFQFIRRLLIVLAVMQAVFPYTRCLCEKNVYIPQGTMYIEDDEFYNDWETTDLYLPPSIISVSYITNQQLHALESYHVDSNSESLVSVDGVLYSKEMDVLFLYPANKSDTCYHIPPSVKYIWAYAFSGNQFIEEIFLPNNVVCVGDGSFYGCSHLSCIHFSEGLQCIGNKAFESTNINDITFPSSLNWIGNAAFRSTKLREVFIPEGVLAIGFEAFALCGSLDRIILPQSLVYMDLPIAYGSNVNQISSLLSVIVDQGSYSDYALRDRNDISLFYSN